MAAKKKTIRTIPQERTPMAERPPAERAKNFTEVACGYRLEDAQREAERCLMCPDQPCVAGCPVGIDIPQFIARIVSQDYRGAYDVITDTNLLPAICGRVCPQENQCEGVCPVGDSGGSDRPHGALGGRWPSPRNGAVRRTSSRTVFESASWDRARPAWPALQTWRRPAAK
jgi:hypothetical protein